jgi:ABC-2 type transport system permease protein
MNLRKTLTVARWEYLEKVKSKAFLIGLFLTPTLMLGFGVLPGLFASKERDTTTAIGVVDLTGRLGVRFAERMGGAYLLADSLPAYIVRPIAHTPGSDPARAIEDARARVAGGEIEGFLIIRSVEPSDSMMEYRGTNVGDFRLGMRIEETVRQMVRERRLAELGLQPTVLRELSADVQVRSVKVKGSGEVEGDADFSSQFIRAYSFLMLLFLLILTSGQMLVRSVMEEKANRIVEVLVSSASTTELMAGKVVGLAALGLTQMAFWALLAVAVSLRIGLPVFDPLQGVLLLVYFVLGYLLYAAVFIGLGSPVSTEQEAQQTTSYLVLVLLFPLMLAIPALQNPDALWLKVLSYVPLLTPTMMALRVSISDPSAAEIASTILLLLASVWGGMWVAGRIFRVAILSTGKRPALREILRWITSG